MHTSSGDICRGVPIAKPAARDLLRSKTTSNSPQQPMEKAVFLSFPFFSREIPHSSLSQKNQRYTTEEQLQRGQCSLGLDDSWVSIATHLSNSQVGDKSRDLCLLHKDLKSRAGPQL